jgi:DNA-binding CsgD family transcriptional regulator
MYLLRKSQAADSSRHIDVGEEQLDVGIRLKQFERLFTIRGFYHLKTSIFEHANRRKANQRFIFNDKNHGVMRSHDSATLIVGLRSMAEHAFNRLKSGAFLMVYLNSDNDGTRIAVTCCHFAASGGGVTTVDRCKCHPTTENSTAKVPSPTPNDDGEATANKCTDCSLLREKDELIRKLLAWREGAASDIGNLTSRQRQIMELVVAGHPSKNIAADLHISQRTVENHRASIMKKTGSRSIPALARLALAAAWSGAEPAAGPAQGQGLLYAQ